MAPFSGSLSDVTPTPIDTSRSSRRELERASEHSSVHSLESCSLTSILELYQRPISRLQQPSSPGGSFYYDFAEGFDEIGPGGSHRTELSICRAKQISDSGQGEPARSPLSMAFRKPRLKCGISDLEAYSTGNGTELAASRTVTPPRGSITTKYKSRLLACSNQDLFRSGQLRSHSLNDLEPILSVEQNQILSPKPVSPVHQLSVKNSIPRFMKSLPPVPALTETNAGGIDITATLSDFIADFAPFSLSRIPTPQSQTPAPTRTGSKSSTHDLTGISDLLTKSPVVNPILTLPRSPSSAHGKTRSLDAFDTRAPAGNSNPSQNCLTSNEDPSLWGRQSNRKTQLRVSLSGCKGVNNDDEGTVRKYGHASTPLLYNQPAAELSKGLLSSSQELQRIFSPTERQNQHPQIEGIPIIPREQQVYKKSKANWDIAGIQGEDRNCLRRHEFDKLVLHDAASFSSESSLARRNGLKRKLSHLCKLLVKPNHLVKEDSEKKRDQPYKCVKWLDQTSHPTTDPTVNSTITKEFASIRCTTPTNSLPGLSDKLDIWKTKCGKAARKLARCARSSLGQSARNKS
jgi:hypothetical protein